MFHVSCFKIQVVIEIIVLGIFLVSLAGVLFLLYRKIPQLTQLPHDGHHGFEKPAVVKHFEKKIKDTHFHLFEKKMLLHTLLSKTKVVILKVEVVIDRLLHGIRKNAQELDKKNKKEK